MTPPQAGPSKSKKKASSNNTTNFVQNDDDDQINNNIVPPGIDKQALKSAIWYTVAKIVEEEEVDLQRPATEPFVASLTELVYAQAETLALDLKAFAAHAGRNTIRADDVRLVARKTTALQDLINEEATRFESTLATAAATTKQAPKAKPRAKRVGVAGPSAARED